MILTPAVAKTKTCLRFIADPHEYQKCLGDGCIAWLWIDENDFPVSSKPTEDMGFCGLAAVPDPKTWKKSMMGH